jgi:hypothetical protein
MAAYLSTELGGSANQTAAPVGYKPRATVYAARLKRMRGTFTYNTQTTSDTLVVGNLPAGATFAFGAITTSASTSTATLAVGISGSTGKYKAAGAVTTTDQPQLFGLAAVVGAADPALSAEEQVFVTIGTASLPGSGTLVVDLYYSMPN